MDFMAAVTLCLFVSTFFFFRVMLANLIRCGEDERFAVFARGRFVSLQGPGRVMKWPLISHFVTIEIGDEGELVTATEVNVKGVLLPARVRDQSETGTRVRVVGFEAEQFKQKLLVAR